MGYQLTKGGRPVIRPKKMETFYFRSGSGAWYSICAANQNAAAIAAVAMGYTVLEIQATEPDSRFVSPATPTPSQG